MASEWIDAKLGDYIDSCLGKMLDKNKNKGEFYPYLGNSNVRWGAFDLDELGQMKFEDHEHVRYGIKAGDLIVCEGGEPGRCAIWEDDLLNMKIQKALHRVRTLDGLDSEFLYYWFLLAGKNKLLDAYFTGTTIKHLTGKALKEIPIKIPPLKHQKQVAVLLRSFDKKIKTNRQINQTLEQMAQAIFKSWFVDFDPVKTKMNGEQPIGIDAATASLFPGKLVESELGLIPEGWEASCMGEHFKITMGQSPKGETYNEDGEGIAFFQGRRDFGFRYPDVRVYTTDPKRYAKAGDTLISVRAPVGDKNMASIDCCIGRGIGAIKHNSDSRSFTYAFMSHIEKKLGDNGSSGTLFNSINLRELKKVPFITPSQELVEAFHNLVEPIDQKIEVLSKEIDSLSQLRDTLLPKLLSGEVDLDAPDSFAEDKLISKLLEQLDFGIEFKLSQHSLPKGYIGFITVSGTFGSNGGTHVHVPTAVKALSKLTTAEGVYGEIAGNVATETLTSGAVELVTNNIIPLGVLTKVCTAVFGKKTPIKPKDAVLLTTIHEATNKSIDGILNEQAKRFAFLELPCMDEQELEQSLQYLESIGVVKNNGKTIVLLDSIVQH